MKALVVCWFSIFCCTLAVAQQKNEEALVHKILICFRNKDDSAYAKLFPKAEDLMTIAANYQPKDEVETRRINNIRSNQKALQQFDPAYNLDIVKDFDFIYQKGVDSGLHWSDLLLARYEFEKSTLTRELIGFEKVVPYRLQGYIFMQDLLTRKLFCMAIRDIHGYGDKWYGGRTVNILEAETIEEYYVKLEKEKKGLKSALLAQMYASTDTVHVAEDSALLATKKKAEPIKKADIDEDEEKKEVTTQVVERKLYKGTYDNEIGLELYVRSLKGKCPQPVCAWEALYKFADQDEYIKLEVTKGEGGKLIFTEEDAGIMELTFSSGEAKGEWTSLKDKTSYEVQLSEKKEVKNRKLFQLDDILEGGDGSVE